MNIAALNLNQQNNPTRMRKEPSFQSTVKFTEPAQKFLNQGLADSYSLCKTKNPEQVRARFIGKNFSFIRHIEAFKKALEDAIQENVTLKFGLDKNEVVGKVIDSNGNKLKGSLSPLEICDLLRTPFDEKKPMSCVAKSFKNEVAEIINKNNSK